MCFCSGFYCLQGAYTPKPEDLANYTAGDCVCPDNSTGGMCQPGTYCPRGSREPTLCEEGQYCGTEGLEQPTGECDAGYYCARGASRADPTDGETGDVCPLGRYCGKCEE